MSVQVPLFEKGDKKASKVAAKVEEIVGEGFDVRKFVENFETIIHAVGGIRSLRKLILELAIRGRLSVRQQGDGTARGLFDAANADRLARQARGEARQMEDLAEPGSDEVPFSLPSTWLWTRIGLAVNLVNGRAFKPKDWSATGLPIIRIQNLNNPNAGYNYCAFPVDPKHHLSPGDFLISWSGTPGTSFGAFIWHGTAGVLNQHIFRAEVYGAAYELPFLKIAINARLDEMIAQAHGGVGLQHITKGKLEALAIPLPSLAEQKRIVAKVDQLMALCDELEAKQTKKRETGARLTKSALDALTSAEGPDEFDAAWKRVVENFDVLIDRAEKVGELHAAVLGLGLKGWLTRSVRKASASDGPPHGWTRTTLGGLACFVTSGSRNWKDYYAETGAVFVRSQDISSDALDLSAPAHVSVPSKVEGTRTRIEMDDILITITGANVGKAAHVDRQVPEAYVSQHVALVRLLDPSLAPWLHRWLVCPSTGRGQLLGSSYGDKPGLNLSQVKSVVVDVPPVAEREHILAQIARCLRLCNELRERLAHGGERASRLVEAVVQEVVAAGTYRPAC